MTASERAKAAGFKNLTEVIKITGVSRSTLIDWSNHKPKLFNVVLAGCLVGKHKDVIVELFNNAR